jgi:hypothetical protein
MGTPLKSESAELNQWPSMSYSIISIIALRLRYLITPLGKLVVKHVGSVRILAQFNYDQKLMKTFYKKCNFFLPLRLFLIF